MQNILYVVNDLIKEPLIFSSHLCRQSKCSFDSVGTHRPMIQIFYISGETEISIDCIFRMLRFPLFKPKNIGNSGGKLLVFYVRQNLLKE